jgi:hypothetical protein
MVRIISGGLGELVRPCVYDGITIDVLDTCHDALFEFVFRGHSDVAQDRAGELGEEAFDEVEPGAVLGREGELEAAGRLGSEPSSRFSGDVRGMIVEDQLDRGTRRISRIEKLEELDELSAAVAVSDQGMDLAGEQINPGQQAERAVTLVLVRIAMLLGLVARQRHQPSLGLRRDRRLLAGSRSIIEGRQRAIGHRPFDAALHGLMMHFEALSHGKERTSFRWAGLRTALDTKSRTDGGMQTAVQGYVPDC